MRLVVDISDKTWPVNALEQYGPVLPLSERRYFQGCSLSDLAFLDILRVAFISAMAGFIRFVQGHMYCPKEIWKRTPGGE